MNLEQRNQLSEILKQFSIEKLIINMNSNYAGSPPDMGIVGSYSINTLVHTVTKIFRQLEEITLTEDYAVYLADFTPLMHGPSNIIVEVNNLLSTINEGRNLTDNFINIDWLIAYLLYYNLWNKERSKISIEALESKEIALSLLIDKNRKESELLESYKEEYIKTLAQLSSEMGVITQFILDKNQQINVIEESSDTIAAQKKEVDTIVKAINRIEVEISTTQKNHNNLFDQLKTQKESQDKEFKALIEDVEQNQKTITTYIDLILDKFEYFNSQKVFVEAKKQEIIELGALAAGGALGGTYGLRQTAINKNLGFWRWGVFIVNSA